MLPNLLWMVFPPTARPAAPTGSQRSTLNVLGVLEGLDRIGVFAIPFAASLFGIGHLALSWREYQRMRKGFTTYVVHESSR